MKIKTSTLCDETATEFETFVFVTGVDGDGQITLTLTEYEKQTRLESDCEVNTNEWEKSAVWFRVDVFGKSNCPPPFVPDFILADARQMLAYGAKFIIPQVSKDRLARVVESLRLKHERTAQEFQNAQRALADFEQTVLPFDDSKENISGD